MSSTVVIHEGFMNGSGMILPRVGGGGRGGGGLGVRGGEPSIHLTVGVGDAPKGWMD